MFKQESKSTASEENRIPHSPQSSAYLGRSLSFRGSINGNENLTVCGKVEGQITLGNCDLTIEAGSKVKANIRAKNVFIKGSVEGNIDAQGKVFIEKQGQMIGDISASRISVVEGAQFKGSVKILTLPKNSSPSP